MKVYHARSISIYGTPQDERDRALLGALGFDVVDPNQPSHQEGYAREGMNHFTRTVTECSALAFRAHPDGSIPAGVAKEIATAQDWNIPVIELPHGIQRRALTVEQTREYLCEVGHR